MSKRTARNCLADTAFAPEDDDFVLDKNRPGRSQPMLNIATKTEASGAEQELTDGFHLVIDALKLNGITTIYGVPGIPITDLGRMAQAEGIRVLSFRHEQNAGYAAAIAGFLTKKPGVCLTVSAPGFLNTNPVLRLPFPPPALLTAHAAGPPPTPICSPFSVPWAPWGRRAGD